MSSIGTVEPPLRVAVVGSGPAGFYAVENLLRAHGIAIRADMFDRLPTPFGLVRGGVAPDHQNIKGVVAAYEAVASDPRVRFFGNVKLGRDISVEDLRARYHQIVYAVGCESDRRMGIPGEDLHGSFSATDFVGWYNGHPDHRDHHFDLSCEAVAIVGVGNVAIDVARILGQDPARLAKTDIASYAVHTLRTSKIKRIYLLGRRGPVQAAFSPRELDELAGIPGAHVIVRSEDLDLDEVSALRLTDRRVKNNYESLQRIARRDGRAYSREIVIRFRVSPVELVARDGKIGAIRIEHNTLQPDGAGDVVARGAGRLETLDDVGLVFRAVGYRGVPIPGVPFDQIAGRIANEAGRVTAGGRFVPGEYVVGWAKRGPSGLIGANRADSRATVQAMLADLKNDRVRQRVLDVSPDAIPRLLRERGVRYITFSDWKVLDNLERTRGQRRGKIRDKFTSVDDMLTALV